MGDVQHFETDLAWAGLFYLEERLPYYDIIYPYLFDKVCFLVKQFFGNFNFKTTSNGKIMPDF